MSAHGEANIMAADSARRMHPPEPMEWRAVRRPSRNKECGLLQCLQEVVDCVDP